MFLCVVSLDDPTEETTFEPGHKLYHLFLVCFTFLRVPDASRAVLFLSFVCYVVNLANFGVS